MHPRLYVDPSAESLFHADKVGLEKVIDTSAYRCPGALVFRMNRGSHASQLTIDDPTAYLRIVVSFASRES